MSINNFNSLGITADSENEQNQVNPFGTKYVQTKPSNGMYHLTFEDIYPELNWMSVDGCSSNRMIFEGTLTNLDGLSFPYRKVFSDKGMSMKYYQEYMNGLLNALGLKEIESHQALVGCEAEVEIEINGDFANIVKIYEAQLAKLTTTSEQGQQVGLIYPIPESADE